MLEGKISTAESSRRVSFNAGLHDLLLVLAKTHSLVFLHIRRRSKDIIKRDRCWIIHIIKTKRSEIYLNAKIFLRWFS
jgi:hypothetical protein